MNSEPLSRIPIDAYFLSSGGEYRTGEVVLEEGFVSLCVLGDGMAPHKTENDFPSNIVFPGPLDFCVAVFCRGGFILPKESRIIFPIWASANRPFLPTGLLVNLGGQNGLPRKVELKADGESVALEWGELGEFGKCPSAGRGILKLG